MADQGVACPACGAKADAQQLRLIIPPRPALTRREVFVLGLATTALVAVSVAGTWMQASDLIWYAPHWGSRLSPLGRWAIDVRIAGVAYTCLLVGVVAASSLAWQLASRRKTLTPWIVWAAIVFLIGTVALQTVVSITSDGILFRTLGMLG